jgi:hypothetical protein
MCYPRALNKGFHSDANNCEQVGRKVHDTQHLRHFQHGRLLHPSFRRYCLDLSSPNLTCEKDRSEATVGIGDLEEMEECGAVVKIGKFEEREECGGAVESERSEEETEETKGMPEKAIRRKA